MFGGSNISLADIAAVMGRNNGNGIGDGNGWWVLIILLALFGENGFGFGNRGNNGGNNGTNPTVIMPPMGGYGMYGASAFGFENAAMQRGFDNQTVINKLDGINNGLCSLGYDQLSQMNGINTNIMQTGFGLQQAINNDTVSNMQNTNQLSSQIRDCCCNLERLMATAEYQRATNTCQITNTMQSGFNALGRQIEDLGCQIRMDNYQARISELEAKNQDLRLKQSQADQNVFFQNALNGAVRQLQPTPVPSFNVPNPYTWNSWNGNGCCGQAC